jgi:hypothetical protein
MDHVLYMKQQKDHASLFFAVPEGGNVHVLWVKETLEEIHKINPLR